MAEPVLVVVEVCAVRDPDGLKAYQREARHQVDIRGGKVIAFGSTPIEGDPPFETVMVQQWPSEDAFLGWQTSAEYRPLLELRKSCADIRISIVRMVAPL